MTQNWSKCISIGYTRRKTVYTCCDRDHKLEFVEDDPGTPQATQDRKCYDTNVEQCIKLWIFGDKHEVPRLQNDAIDDLRALLSIQNTPPLRESSVIHAWENAGLGSELREFIAFAYGSVQELQKPPPVTKLSMALVQTALWYTYHDMDDNYTSVGWQERWDNVDMNFFYVGIPDEEEEGAASLQRQMSSMRIGSPLA